MRTMLAAAAAAAVVIGFSFGAAAMPASPAQPGQTYSAAPGVIPVAGGCGIGFHRGPYGGCRRNGPVVYARPAFVGPRCFWRRGPYGRMFRVCR